MKIEIKNLGPISKFTFDVEKDLHLIYGKNSVGKSYAIYCIYILLKTFNDISKIPFTSFDKTTTKNEDILSESSITIANKGRQIKIEKVFNKILIGHFNDVYSNEITRSFNNTFSLNDLDNLYSNKKLEIRIASNGICLVLNINEQNQIIVNKIIWDVPLEIFKKSEREYLLYIGANEYSFFIRNPELLLDASIDYIREIFTLSSKQILDQIYFLPSSRSGLYLGVNSLAPIITEFSKFRSQLKNKIDLPSFSEPISDYILELSNASAKKIDSQFALIVKQFEEDILQGTIILDDDNKRMLFQPTGAKFKMNLSATSSMVSEIAPIVTYFKHIINQEQSFFGPSEKRKSIIFIEEPEAHLHPEIQVRLMEIFAELTEKHNIKVVITSHSNYMFNKLVNMILAKKVDVNKVVVNNMVMTKLGSIVDENMTVTEDGVEDFNFSQTSEKLYEERMNIVD